MKQGRRGRVLRVFSCFAAGSLVGIAARSAGDGWLSVRRRHNSPFWQQAPPTEFPHLPDSSSNLLDTPFYRHPPYLFQSVVCCSWFRRLTPFLKILFFPPPSPGDPGSGPFFFSPLQRRTSVCRRITRAAVSWLSGVLLHRGDALSRLRLRMGAFSTLVFSFYLSFSKLIRLMIRMSVRICKLLMLV